MNTLANPDADPIPAELLLLAACCEHPKTDASVARVEKCAKAIDDWRQVGAAARRHQVQGFVQDRLSACDTVPENVRALWAQEARSRATFNLLQARATGQLHGLLNRHGIPNLVIKGLPLAAKVYGSLTIKRSSDVDLLIRPDDAWKAVDLLASEGFVATETGRALNERQTAAVARHFKEITLRNGSGIVIDLHWRLIEHRAVLGEMNPFDNAMRVSIDNIGEIAVLGEEDEFAYLCAHGALSDWSRFKWLADVNALLGDRSDEAIERLFDHAERHGAGPSALQALGLRALFWDRPMPNALGRKLEQLRQPDLLSYPVARMSEPYRPASSRDTLKRLADQSRIRATLYGATSGRAHEVGSHLHALPDVLAVPLPARLDWLYIPLRPVRWLMRKLRR